MFITQSASFTRREATINETFPVSQTVGKDYFQAVLFKARQDWFGKELVTELWQPGGFIACLITMQQFQLNRRQFLFVIS